MKKNKLTFEDNYKVEIFGVSTHSKRHKFCWNLGKVLQQDFIRIEDLKLSPSDQIKFSCFTNANKEFERCHVIENKSDGYYYAPKYKNADFFVVVNKDDSINPLNDIDQQIRQLEDTLLVFKIDAAKDKTSDIFLFD